MLIIFLLCCSSELLTFDLLHMSVILDAHIIMFLNVRGKLHHLKDLKDAACIKVEFYLIHSAD